MSISKRLVSKSQKLIQAGKGYGVKLHFCFIFSVYHALYLETLSVAAVIEKIAGLYSVKPTQIIESYVVGPSGILVLVNDDVSYHTVIYEFYIILTVYYDVLNM